MSEILSTHQQNMKTSAPAKKSSAKGKMVTALLLGAIGGFGTNSIISAMTSDDTKVEYASNQLVNTVYGINAVENPEFNGDKLLKINDETKLAEVCDRPTLTEVSYKLPLNCVTP